MVKYEESKDLNKVISRTITKQSFSEFEPDENARTYRKECIDATWTVVEDYLYDQGTAAWAVDGTVSTEPLESCKIFSSSIPLELRRNWAAWKRNPMSPMLLMTQAMGNTAAVYWDPVKDGCKNYQFETFYKRWVIGYDSFLAPKIVIRMTELEDGPPSQAHVGQIDDGWQGSNVPVPTGVNFILTAARGVLEGDKWRNTYEWMGSSTNSLNVDNNPGWDPLVYGATP